MNETTKKVSKRMVDCIRTFSSHAAIVKKEILVDAICELEADLSTANKENADFIQDAIDLLQRRF